LSSLQGAANKIAAANAILKSKKRVTRITRVLFLYRLIQYVSFPFIFCYFLGRILFFPAYRPHFVERLGFLPQSFSRTKPGAIWLHAVSVGEIASALPLIRRLRAQQPGIPFYLSTATIAGRSAALRQAAPLVDGIFYAPIDFASCIRRILRATRPALVIVLETEIWPNLYSEISRCGARLAIVNGRISNRTWPQYQAWRWFFAPILKFPDCIIVQSPTDFERYSHLGVPARCLSILGNLKYEALAAQPHSTLPTFGAEHIWVAASTVGPNERGSITRHFVDEDDIVIETFQQLTRDFPKLLLILAPRQPARFPEVARKIIASGLPFLRRTELQNDSALALPGILLLDSMGELASLYSLADVVFVGGSLAPRGGHNIIEPGAAGVPVIVGPHMHNFEVITRDFLEHQAIVQIQREHDLLPALHDLLSNPRRAADMGKRGQQFVRSQQGVSEAVADRLWPLYHTACWRTPHSALSRLFLSPLALLWRWGGNLKRSGNERRAAGLLPLPVPVVSVGGITIGGSGKTPFTNYLAAALKAHRHSPAILTRGYGRRFPADSIVLPPTAKVSALMTGDEAQIFLRAAIAPIGIGAKRYETAQILLRQFPATDVLLLDDGFQHARLDRDFDIVVIDGLDPFGQEDLVPLGRLREPLTALRRAGAFVVTRAENDFRFDFIRRRLRDFNPTAPAFRTRLVSRAWRDYRTGESVPSLADKRVGAFCGLGNPENFWSTLESLGLEVVFRWSFDDHHNYKPTEVYSLAQQAKEYGAEMLVTTEKDRINCPNNMESALAPLNLFWLEIEFELENEGAFFEVLERKLARRV
jgi:3-deoxy-D-manno-octulosonic-acid transferase